MQPRGITEHHLLCVRKSWTGILRSTLWSFTHVIHTRALGCECILIISILWRGSWDTQRVGVHLKWPTQWGGLSWESMCAVWLQSLAPWLQHPAGGQPVAQRTMKGTGGRWGREVTTSKVLGSLVLFSRSVISNSLWLHGLQCARLSCPSLSPRVCSKFPRWLTSQYCPWKLQSTALPSSDPWGPGSCQSSSHSPWVGKEGASFQANCTSPSSLSRLNGWSCCRGRLVSCSPGGCWFAGLVVWTLPLPPAT